MRPSTTGHVRLPSCRQSLAFVRRRILRSQLSEVGRLDSLACQDWLIRSTRGLTGSGLNTFHQNQADNVIAYHRWHQGGPGDDVVVVVNLSHLAHENYRLGFPAPETWRLRLNSDWSGYSRGFGNQACSDVITGAVTPEGPQQANSVRRDGFPASGTINIGPYSVLVFSQEKPGD
ncbi:MAG: alpha amylase C-terminal domain-containing protein [Pirellulales bacterium]|nr:alpha amylase C-terminal domain-containing protein [Pirellulales bacterium]